MEQLRKAFEAWLLKDQAPALGLGVAAPSGTTLIWRAFLTGYAFAKVETDGGFDVAFAALLQDSLPDGVVAQRLGRDRP